MGMVKVSDYRTPYKAPEGSYYYGAKGWRAVRIFENCELCDIDAQSQPKISSNIPIDLATRILKFFPRIKVANVLQHEFNDKWMFSNAWHKTWGASEIDALMKMVSQQSVIKFKCDFKMLSDVLKAQPKEFFPITLFYFGRPTSFEVFLTKMDNVKPDNEYVFTLNYNDFSDVLLGLLSRKLHVMSDFHISTYSSFSRVILRERRPFKIKNWMWPCIAGPASLKKSLGIDKMLSLTDISTVIDDDGLREMDMNDFSETHLVGDSVKSENVVSPRIEVSNNNSNSNRNTKKTPDPNEYEEYDLSALDIS